MKRKPVPVPPTYLDALAEYRRALPLVPGSEDDCCARLQSREGVADRSTAGEWLEFLCALGLADETQTGFARTRADLDDEDLARNFEDGVVLAADVLDTLRSEDDPLDADAVFAAVQDRVPTWEQRKRDDWQDVWRERVERLLDWAVLFGLAESTDSRYTVPDGGRA